MADIDQSTEEYLSDMFDRLIEMLIDKYHFEPDTETIIIGLSRIEKDSLDTLSQLYRGFEYLVTLMDRIQRGEAYLERKDLTEGQRSKGERTYLALAEEMVSLMERLQEITPGKKVVPIHSPINVVAPTVIKAQERRKLVEMFPGLAEQYKILGWDYGAELIER